MKKFAQIYVPTGEVHGIVNVQSGYDFPTGTQSTGTRHEELPNNVDDITFPQTNYWRNSQWNTREVCPGDHYYWRDFAWVKDLEPFWQGIRYARDVLLKESDWTQLPDSGVTGDSLTAWTTYRQALRDLPSTYSTAETEDDILWPGKPV